MQTKNIISVAAVVASFAGAALAGTPVKIVAPTPVPAPVATSSPLSGDIYAGYASNYTCRGIVASHSLTEGDGIIPASVDLNYKLDVRCQLHRGFRFLYDLDFRPPSHGGQGYFLPQ